MSAKKAKQMKNVTLSKTGIWNNINFSQSAFENAVKRFESDPASIPVVVGHSDFMYNPADIAQQSAHGWILKLWMDQNLLKADLEINEDLADVIERGALKHLSIEGIMIGASSNPDTGVREMEGLHLTAVAALGRDRPAVAEARFSLKETFFPPAYQALEKEGDRIFLTGEVSSKDRNKLKQEDLMSEKKQVTISHEELAQLKADQIELKKMKEESSRNTNPEISQQKEEVVSRSQLREQVTRSNQFALKSAVALSEGRITPAELETMQIKLSETEDMTKEEFNKLMERLNKTEVQLSMQPTLSSKAGLEQANDWQDMQAITDEVNRIRKEEGISLQEASDKFYKKNPEARKF